MLRRLLAIGMVAFVALPMASQQTSKDDTNSSKRAEKQPPATAASDDSTQKGKDDANSSKQPEKPGDSTQSGGVAPTGDDATGNGTGANDKATAPPVKDILAWISGKITNPSVYGSVKAVEQLTSHGCAATFTLAIGEPDHPHNTQTTILDLDKLSPDSVKGDAATANGETHTYVIFESELGFTTHVVSYLLSTDAILSHKSPDIRREDEVHSKQFAYYVDDADMTKRMVHAWHDAIVGCGGKAVSKDLY